jgi:Lipocalin-like domain
MTMLNPLFGVWKIVSFQFEIEGADERHDVYDRQPSGYLIVTADRMMALITAGDRPSDASPSTLFDSMTAYSGRYRLHDNGEITTVDCAWHPGWLGTEQIRYFKLDGNKLSLTSPFQQHPKFPGSQVRGIAVWQREEAHEGSQ